MAYAFTLSATKYLERTSDLPDYNGNYTICFWIKFNQLTTFDAMVTLSDGSANNRDLLLLNNTTGNNLTSRVAVGGAQTTQAGSTTLSTGTWYHVAMVRDAQNALKVYLNGNLEGTNTRSTTGRAAISQFRIAIEQGGGNPIDASFAHFKMWTRALSVQELLSESRVIRLVNPVSVYGWWPTLINGERNKDYSGKGHDWTENGTIGDVANPPVGWGAPSVSYFYVPVTSISGTASITEDDDTLVSTGTLPIVGTASITEADDTLSAQGGGVGNQGQVSITEEDDTLASSGVLAIMATLAITEDDDSLSASGVLPIVGTVALTEADDTLASAGTLPITGTFAQGEANDTLVATATLPIVGSLTLTEADDSLDATGTGADVNTGVLNVTEADDVLVATSIIFAFVGHATIEIIDANTGEISITDANNGTLEVFDVHVGSIEVS